MSTMYFATGVSNQLVCGFCKEMDCNQEQTNFIDKPFRPYNTHVDQQFNIPINTKPAIREKYDFVVKTTGTESFCLFP